MRDLSHGRAYIITAALLGGFVAGCANHAPPQPQQAAASPASEGRTPTPIPAASRLPATAESLATKVGANFGAAGGWIIAATPQHLSQDSRKEAQEANRRAEQRPASPADVENSPTADLNQDGFVTVDEVLAMQRADLTDAQIIQRLQAGGQVFALTDRQQQYLRDRGVSQSVIDAMLMMKK